MNNVYNKVYDFNWLVQEIFGDIIITLFDGNNVIGNYQIYDILLHGFEKTNVRFANYDDLLKFISNSYIRFTSIADDRNIIDIPIRKLAMLYENANGIGEHINKKIELSNLDAFSVYNDTIINENYMIAVSKINEESPELSLIMNIAKNIGVFGMQEKFDALNKINLINYNKIKENIKSA